MKNVQRRPQAVMLSKRANVFYLEHVRIMQREDRVVYCTEFADGVEKFFSIADKNTAFILLGKGTSITDAAVRKLSESNVLIGFSGSGGAPFFSGIDPVFLLPQDEYRPTDHAQKWFNLWSIEPQRVAMGRALLEYRATWTKEMYERLGVSVDSSVFSDFFSRLEYCTSSTALLSCEAVFAKRLYATFARFYKVEEFTRTAGAKKNETLIQRINSFIDHGNYLAYGYAGVALHGMGIPFFLPVLHGKTRRGGLVFDIADLFKDWLVLPAAFDHGSKNNKKDSDFRASVIELALKYEVLDRVMNFISDLPKKISKNQ